MRKNLFLVLAVLIGFVGASNSSLAQGTAFTYQGLLSVSNSLANGSFDIRTSLFNTNSGGSAIAGPITNTAVGVTNGLFTIPLDFGSVFDGTTLWLQIAVRTNGGGTFNALTPRQQLTPTPYAIFAEGANAAGLTGAIPSGDLSGTYGSPITLNNAGNSFSGNGSGLTGVNALTLDGLGATAFWNTTGNAGTTAGVNFLGTTDLQPLELHVGGMRSFQLRPTTNASNVSNIVNVLAGSSANYVGPSVFGGTIAGGGALRYIAVTAGSNSVLNDFGTISGGLGNTTMSIGATVAGGENNSSGGVFAFPTVGGGDGNQSVGYATTISGGENNSASQFYDAVGGGSGNSAQGGSSTVPGGANNIAGGSGSFAAGQDAQTTHAGTFIWGDGSVSPFTGANFDNGFNVLASSGVFFFNGSQGVHVDYLNQNAGSINYGLRFGAGASGEGIASERVPGGNQFGLDFYTSGNNRMSIANNGFVGINTTNPTTRLEVNGEFLMVDGKSGVQAYLGDDGSGGDVQVGALESGITSVSFYNETDGAFMHITCSSITIKGGADLAEPFEISSAASVPEGAVVVIDDKNPGHLKLSSQAYDTRVAGVVSGANGVNPGIQMQQEGMLEGGKNVALTGRVYVLADASNGAIHPGDLLTSSATPGHAMKVTNHAKAQGAILGKAMTSLDQGKGMVLVLVTLQ